MTRSSAPTGPSPAATASASSSATVGNSASMRSSRCGTCWVSHRSRASTPATAPDRQRTSSGTGEKLPLAPTSRLSARPRQQTEAAPDDLLDPELLDGHVAAGARAGAAHEAAPPSTRSTAARRRPTNGPKSRQRRERRQRLRSRAQQPGRRRGVAQVGRQPVVEARPAQRRAAGRQRRQSTPGQQPTGAGSPRQAPSPPSQAAHRSTRSSSGSRPIRSINR